MVSPSICGGFLTDKRSMVAFTWTITTVLTFFAFLTAVVLAAEIHSHYRRMERYYQTDDWYNTYMSNNQQGGGGEGQKEQGSHDAQKTQQAYLLLSSLSAKSITFASVYTMMMATALSLYGTTAIVGFTSLRGVYIAPCFSSDSNMMGVGIFGGAIVIFANLLVVCAVILGEVRVEDYRDNAEGDEMEPYQVERIATVLAVTCMFLSALYTIFAILLFLCYAGEETQLLDRMDRHHDGGSSHHHAKPLVTVTTADQRHMDMDGPGFITMENSSQGTST